MAIGPERILDQAQAVCAEFRQDEGYSYLHYNCIHGMGHGFMAVFGTDVFQSLAGCDGWRRRGSSSTATAVSSWRISAPWTTPSGLRRTCALTSRSIRARRCSHSTRPSVTSNRPRMRSTSATATSGRSSSSAGTSPTRTSAAVCHQGIGGDAAITSSKYVIGVAAQAATTRQLCLLGPDAEARANCIVGAVITIVRDLAGDDTKARALCAALADRELADVCEETRETAIRGVPATGGAHHH